MSRLPGATRADAGAGAGAGAGVGVGVGADGLDGPRAGVGWRQRARVGFAALWLGGQTALVATSGGRPDHIFGFRMFPEASTIEIHLWRDTASGPIRAAGGEWSARDASGQLRHFAWRDRVRDPILASIDTRVFASYGVDAQLARLGRALDDVAGHLPDDAETRRLRAEVSIRRNGREPVDVSLVSHLRGP